MANWQIVLGVSALYLIASLAVGWRSGKGSSDTATGYVAGDRTLGLLVMYFITGATIFSAFAFLGGPGWAYSRGAAAFYILAYGALGLLPFYFWGPRAARLGRAFGYVTQAEMVGGRFNSRALTGTMAAISLIAFVPYLAIQIKGAGLVLEIVTEGRLAPEIGGAIVYAVVLAYVLKSGVLGVGWTNTFQGIFMMALAWGLGLYLPTKLYGGVGEMFERIAAERPEMLSIPGLDATGASWGQGEYATAILVSAIGFSAWPHLFMKAFTAKSEAVLKKTVVLYPTFQIFLVPLFLIGFAGVLFESAPPATDQILPHLLMQLDVSPWIVGLFCAGALAASMSSGDAMAHAAASIGVRDGLVRGLGREIDEVKQTAMIRVAVVAVMIAAYSVAVGSGASLVALLLATYGAIVQFAPTITATLYWKRARAGALLAGLLLGAGVTALFIVMPDWRPLPWHAGVFGLIVNVATIVIGSRGGNDDPHQAKFLEIAGK